MSTAKDIKRMLATPEEEAELGEAEPTVEDVITEDDMIAGLPPAQPEEAPVWKYRALRHDGTETEFLRDTGETCSACGRQTVAVRLETETTVMLECKHCGEEQHRRKGMA